MKFLLKLMLCLMLLPFLILIFPFKLLFGNNRSKEKYSYLDEFSIIDDILS